MREYEFVTSVGNCLWPNNTTKTQFNFDRFLSNFKNRIGFCLQHGKSFPVNTVAKALAELENTSVEEALGFIGKESVDKETGESIASLSTKANREYAIREGVDLSKFNGRQYALLCAFKEHGQASVFQITSLVEGKLKTKSSLSRVVTYFVNKLTSQGILEIVA